MKARKLIGLAAAAVVLAGCAGGTGPTPTVTVTVTATATVTATPAAAPPQADESMQTDSSAEGGSPVTSSVKYVKEISPYGSANADEFFELRPTFTNVSSQRITAIKGKMILADPFGTEVFTGSWQATGMRLDPAESYVQKGFGFTVGGSTGSPGCQGGLAEFNDQDGLCRAADAKFVDYTWTFEPESVKFSDGTFWP